MSSEENSRFVRLQVELVMEVTDQARLAGAAHERIADDAFMTDAERQEARTTVEKDAAESLAYLVDPVDLVTALPGVELAQASWSSEEIEYDPASAEWDLVGAGED
ncbi:hypothetical protein ACFV3R_20260 [Streptomyces sp. NPDC059740]|uniref:hypothetical protein n=1 Tax=Streptomyces sp. NPDC059740 TaxID=3346926 RepID=UPI00366262CF